MRADPTRTTALVRAFRRAIAARFRRIAHAVEELLVERDALGLLPAKRLLENKRHLFPEPDGWRFRTDPEKRALFERWLAQNVDATVLDRSSDGRPWTGRFVESAYKKGLTRAFVDARRAELGQRSDDFLGGSQAEFLRSSFGQAEQAAKLELLGTRSFEDLRGVTTEMARQLNETLADGMLKGENPRVVAREMVEQIEDLSKSRAELIARTEVIHAHAEGQLDAFESLGVEGVGVLAEWSTAGDDRVCARCAELEGDVMTIAEARGRLPRHPRCRCAFLPADASERRDRLAAAIARRK